MNGWKETGDWEEEKIWYLSDFLILSSTLPSRER